MNVFQPSVADVIFHVYRPSHGGPIHLPGPHGVIPTLQSKVYNRTCVICPFTSDQNLVPNP